MSRRIFRDTALRRYNDSIGKIVLPRFASPPWQVVLWALVGLLLVLAALLWFTRTPVYASGPAVFVRLPNNFAGEGGIGLVAFLPPEFASHLQVGQQAIVHLPGRDPDGPAAVITQTVLAVERSVASPASVRSRYGLDSSTGLLVDGPTVVALIRLETSAETMLGSVGEVQIVVGAQPGFALLPGIGHLLTVDNHASR
jgi:hypothetical protein